MPAEKLNDAAENKSASAMSTTTEDKKDKIASFSSFDLLPQLARAISKLKYAKPTSVQQQMIPIAVQGKNIIAKARTGSGKTVAYCLPIVQKILSLKTLDPSAKTRALILVPTGELAHQVKTNLQDLTLYCSKEVKVVSLTRNMPENLQKYAVPTCFQIDC
jgi:ATP-dependent RNA helicase DDX56/DBP9